MHLRSPSPSLPAGVRPPLFRAEAILRPMRGGSQSLLTRDTTQRYWIVKRQENAQHSNLVINEYLGTRLAQLIHLSVPVIGLMDFSQGYQDLTLLRAPLRGLHFACEYGGRTEESVLDTVRYEELLTASNLAEITGVLAFDTWVCNQDRRQAIYMRHAISAQDLRMLWIDQGHCFGADDWRMQTYGFPWLFRRNPIYCRLSHWNDFEPWLSRLEQISDETLCAVFSELPEQWTKGRETQLSSLREQLCRRRDGIRGALLSVIYSRRRLFLNWPPMPHGSIIEDAFSAGVQRLPCSRQDAGNLTATRSGSRLPNTQAYFSGNSSAALAEKGALHG